MRAVILAAGVGSRLRPYTEAVPKTLVQVGGRPILSYQIDALFAAGVTEIVICAGHLAHLVASDCESRYPGQPITLVQNPDYASTNNMYSLYLAREYLRGDVLIMNGDVCFEADVVTRLMDTEGSAVAVDTGTYLDEAMKIVADQYVSDISKTIPRDEALGCSIDIYKFVAADVDSLVESLTRIIEEEGDLNQWTEVLLQRLFAAGNILAQPCPVSGRWMEIDDYRDLNLAEKMFNPRFQQLESKKLFFFDRDGTLSLGDTIIEGAGRLLEHLNARGIPFYILTNNSSRTRREHFERMAHLPISEAHIVVSTDAALEYLRNNGLSRIFLSATETVTTRFREEGFVPVETDPDAVVLTYNNEITYGQIKGLVEALRADVPYLVTHTDLLYPYEGGFLPDIGCLINMIESATGRRPDRQFGKPAPAMVSHILDRHGVDPSETVIVGDRLYTDIALADDTDMESVLVLSGETSREDLLESQRQPGVVIESVADLIELFG